MTPDHDPVRVSMLLIAYNQAHTVRAAIEAALAQTHSPLEILVSDDASTDDTYAVMQEALRGYTGPHRVRLMRNERNLGIGAHVSKVALAAEGELLLVTAGDDTSHPQRAARMAELWQASGRQLDLIACSLQDIDAEGRELSRIVPSDLSRWRSADDWLRERPHVVGAGQAWTRRLFERFGPMPQGVVAEDLVVVFRAIVSGGAITVDEPLVSYRQGGLSRPPKPASAADVVARWVRNATHSVVEYATLQADADRAGCGDAMRAWAAPRLQKEELVLALFGPKRSPRPWHALAAASAVPLQARWRLLVYRFAPGLLAPVFWLKGLRRR